MARLELAGTVFKVDEKGFLQEPDKWSEDIARAYAALEGVTDLTGDHWSVIHYLRDYYFENGICPMIRKLRMATGFNMKQLYDLFPEGPANSACKWAGLPKPTGCV